MLQTLADMCVADGAGGAVGTWLRVVPSRAIMHTHAHARACLRRKQRTKAVVSDCTHTHVCCRSKESVVTLPAAWILCAQPPVSQTQAAEATMSQAVHFVMFVPLLSHRGVFRGHKESVVTATGVGLSKQCV